MKAIILGIAAIAAPALAQCPAKGDFNGDCKVNLVDFSILAYLSLHTIGNYSHPVFP